MDLQIRRSRRIVQAQSQNPVIFINNIYIEEERDLHISSIPINNELIVRQNEWDSGFPCYTNVCSGFYMEFSLIPPGFVINDKSNIYYLGDVYEIHRYHTI